MKTENLQQPKAHQSGYFLLVFGLSCRTCYKRVRCKDDRYIIPFCILCLMSTISLYNLYRSFPKMRNCKQFNSRFNAFKCLNA